MSAAGIHRPQEPVIAVSNRPFADADTLIAYCREKGLHGVDYSFAYDALVPKDLLPDVAWIEKLLAAGIEVRYHCPFHNCDMADARKEQAGRSLAFFKECIDFAGQFGGRYITVHIGLRLKYIRDLDYPTAIAHLSELVQYGAEKGMTVCLENLTKGWTNHPALFSEMIRRTGAGLTFDLGHANACPWTGEGQRTGVDFLQTVSGQVINAHVYEIERIDPETLEPYHQVPRDLQRIAPLLAGLLDRKCDWWLIELSRLAEVEHTRALLEEYLNDPRR